MRKEFATGRRRLVAAAGVVQTTRRLEGALPPVAASQTCMTRWAFPMRNCSDRSWCGTETVHTFKAATPVGETHATDSRKNASTRRGERKRF